MNSSTLPLLKLNTWLKLNQNW